VERVGNAISQLETEEDVIKKYFSGGQNVGILGIRKCERKWKYGRTRI
jgi:hypothetical protein